MKHQLLCSLLFLLSLKGFAQTDSSGRLVIVTDIGPGKATNILNGKSHISYPASIEGYAYIFADWKEGSVVYEGIQYSSVQLKYDLYRDELVLLHPNGLPLVLFTPRVSSFVIQDREYVSLNPGSVTAIEAGYFEVLQKGNIELFAKRIKTLDEKVHTSGVDKSFVFKTEYFARKNGVLHRIKKESHLLDLVPDKKQAAKNMLRESGLSFNTDPEAALLMIAKSYNQSSN